VAYLYNGVRLPKLPEWYKEKYPYACISRYTNDTGETEFYRLCLYDKEGVLQRAWSTYDLTAPKGTTYEGYYIYETGDPDAWTYWALQSGGPTNNPGTYIIPVKDAGWDFVWSNIDLYNEDGSFAYSGGPDPVPVYE
jgi:hypothetical protein